MKIKAQKRELTGKQVQKLRKEKQLPASIYGPGIASQNVVLDPSEFKHVFSDSGYSKLIDLETDGTNSKVLVKEVQVNPLTDEVIHVSLYQVNMKKEITAEVPIVIEGESPAVKNNLGLMVTNIDSVAVHCLPGDLPAELKIEVTNLNEIGDSILLSALQLPAGVEFAPGVNTENPIVYISAPQKAIVEETPETAEGTAEAGSEGTGTETEATPASE